MYRSRTRTLQRRGCDATGTRSTHAAVSPFRSATDRATRSSRAGTPVFGAATSAASSVAACLPGRGRAPIGHRRCSWVHGVRPWPREALSSFVGAWVHVPHRRSLCACRGDALRSRVKPACSEAAEGGVVVGLDRRDVREHGWQAEEPLHEHCAMYLYTSCVHHRVRTPYCTQPLCRADRNVVRRSVTRRYGLAC